MTRPRSAIEELPQFCNDPTEEPDVVEVKKRILENPKVREYLNCLSRKNLGLVLSGGGGKGAYEAGCLVALFDCGITKFCAIAGTSVGALNAALGYELFRTADRNRVVELWSTMSPKKVLGWNPVQLVAALALRLAMFASLISIQLTARVSAIAQRLFGNWLFALGRRSPEFGVLVVLLVTMPFCIAVFFVVAGHLPDPRHCLILALAIITAGGLTGLLRPLISAHLSLLSNKPLRRTIESFIDIASLRRSAVPIYCTVTSLVEYWHPFEDGADETVSESAWRKGDAPGYFRIEHSDNDETAIDLLMQSAALPEIFPKRPIFGQGSVDGGIQDNTPIFPVLTHKPDAVIVIYLDYAQTRNQNLWSDEAARTWWMAEYYFRTLLTREKAGEARKRHIDAHGPIKKGRGVPTLLPEEPVFRREQFLPITPSQPLGGLFCGTLNFSSKKARMLMALGYRDTLLKFEREAEQSFPVQPGTQAAGA
jgi:hypothetical protein